MTVNRIHLLLLSFGTLGLGKAASFLVRPLMAHLVTPREYGQFIVITAPIALISTLAGIGMHQGLLRYWPILRDRDDPGPAIRGLCVFPCLITLLLSLLATGLLGVGRITGLADLSGGTDAVSFGLALCALPGNALLLMLPGTLLAQGRSVLYLFASQLLFHALFFTGIAALTVVGPEEQNLTHMMAMYASATWIAVLVSALMAFRHLRQSTPPLTSGIAMPPAEFFRYSLTLLTSGLSYVAFRTIDRIVLGHWTPAEEIACYSVAATIAATLPSLVLVIDAHASPRLAHAFSQSDLLRVKSVFQRSNEGLLYAASVLAILIISGHQYILGLWGESYRSVGSLLMFLLLAEYLTVILGTTGKMLQLGGRASRDTAIVVSAAIANLILNLALVPRFGIQGAMIAMVVTRSWLALTKAALVYRYWNIVPWSRRHWPWKALSLAAVVLVACQSLLMGVSTPDRPLAKSTAELASAVAGNIRSLLP